MPIASTCLQCRVVHVVRSVAHSQAEWNATWFICFNALCAYPFFLLTYLLENYYLKLAGIFAQQCVGWQWRSARGIEPDTMQQSQKNRMLSDVLANGRTNNNMHT